MSCLMVVDFTKCFPNTQAKCLSTIETYRRTVGAPLDGLVPIIRADQVDLAERFRSNPSLRVVPTIGHVEQVVREIVEDSAARGHRSIKIVSYDGGILKQAQLLGATRGLAVEANSFSNPAISNPIADIPQPTQRWQFDYIAPLDEAVQLLISALSRRRLGSVRQTDVRGLLAQEDRRFAFEGNALASGTVGMVSTLLRIAQQRGAIQLQGAESGNPWVLTQGSGIPPMVTNTSRLFLRPQVIVNKGLDGVTATQSPALRSVGQETPNGNASHGVPTAVLTEVDAVEEPSWVSNGAPTVNPSAQADINAFEHRSRLMEKRIREGNMGPYVKCRNASYDAIEEMMASKTTRTLSELIQLATAGALDKLQEDDASSEYVDKQPWRRLASFLHKILTRSGAVLSDGVPLPESSISLRKPVHSLSDNWRVKADGLILFALIQKMSDVSLYDLPNLGGVLFHDREHAGQEKVLACLEHLITSDAIIEVDVNGDKFFRLP